MPFCIVRPPHALVLTIPCMASRWLKLELTISILTFIITRRLTFIQYRTGVWKSFRSLPPDPSPVLDNISGPMGARFLSSTVLEFGNLIERAQFFPVPALDKSRSPKLPSKRRPRWAARLKFSFFSLEHFNLGGRS